MCDSRPYMLITSSTQATEKPGKRRTMFVHNLPFRMLTKQLTIEAHRRNRMLVGTLESINSATERFYLIIKYATVIYTFNEVKLHQVAVYLAVNIHNKMLNTAMIHPANRLQHANGPAVNCKQYQAPPVSKSRHHSPRDSPNFLASTARAAHDHQLRYALHSSANPQPWV